MPDKRPSPSNSGFCVEDSECSRTIFESREQMLQALSRLCYGNLCLIGSLWIEVLKKVLTGSKMCLVPTVVAADKKEEPKVPEPPKKPPKMKFTDLPLYEHPHREYKDFEEEKENSKCPEIDIHSVLIPYVALVRRHTVHKICVAQNFVCDTCKSACNAFEAKKKEIKCIARDPEKENIRKAVVGVGGLGGLVLGARKGAIFALLYSSIGVLAPGWLCFPKETDREFRNILSKLETTTMTIYSMSCGGVEMRGPAPCESQKPLPPEDPKAKKDKKD